MAKQKKNQQLNRRQLIGQASLAGGAGFLAANLGGSSFARSFQGDANAFNLANPGEKPRFLIVLTCFGGASILDSFMAMSRDEVQAAGGSPNNLNCFGAQQMQELPGTPFRAVSIDHRIGPLGGFRVQASQADFVRKYAKDMLVVTTEGTSVNHGVAQRRSVTGNDAWQGRTLQEAVASHYGKSLPIANLNMGSGGFVLPGIDPSLAGYAQANLVADPRYWALGLHSHAGIAGASNENLLQLARRVRNEQLEPQTNFMKTFRSQTNVKRWLKDRDVQRVKFENLDLTNKLFFLDKKGEGLKEDPQMAMLRQVFPNFERDPLDGQAILSYLAITKGVSTAVTLGPDAAAAASDAGLNGFYNPPIAFDFSHSDHRGTQAMMWQRVLSTADRLIQLLQNTLFDPASGESYWDRSMIYFASDFGRDKLRPGATENFTSGHHLNNASLLLSPMIRGNRILGGLDYQTGLTYGFDLQTGRPEPGRRTSERELYALILKAMRVDTSGSGLPSIGVV